MEIKFGWHFTNEELRDGRPVPNVGVPLIHKGSIIPCESGLHMSEEPFDALKYAPGAILHRVELSGDLVSHGDPVDKWVGRKRAILQSIDITQLLRRFACDQALSVIHHWPDCPKVVLNYLKNPTESKRIAAQDAARDAAWAAARATARATARETAWNAARAATWDAARDAAWDAARAAAWDAAWGVVWDVAWDAVRNDFN